VGEVLGSKDALLAHGVPTRVFTQPGTWEGPLYFDSVAKLRSWRLVLVREFFDALEAYAYGPYMRVPLSDSTALGVSHVTIDNVSTPDELARLWNGVMGPGCCVNLVVHSRALKDPHQLDPLVDSIVRAVADGRLVVLGSVTDVVRGNSTGP
jgi:hypothetical protein